MEKRSQKQKRKIIKGHNIKKQSSEKEFVVHVKCSKKLLNFVKNSIELGKT
jgi:hypothetical protein